MLVDDPRGELRHLVADQIRDRLSCLAVERRNRQVADSLGECCQLLAVGCLSGSASLGLGFFAGFALGFFTGAEFGLSLLAGLALGSGLSLGGFAFLPCLFLGLAAGLFSGFTLGGEPCRGLGFLTRQTLVLGP